MTSIAARSGRARERAGARPAAARDRRALRHDAARRRADDRRRAEPRAEARDRPRARRRRDRPDRGRVPAGLRGRLPGGEADREAGLRAEVWGFSRAVQADVEALVELGVQASVIESPISDGKLAALGVTREKMLDRIRSAVAFAAEQRHPRRVLRGRLVPRRPRLLRRAYAAAADAGAQELVVVDTLGIATPEAAAMLVRAPSTGSVRRARPLARPRRLRARHGCVDRRRAGRRDLGAGDDQRDGRARPGTRISPRSRSRSRRSTGSRPGST